MIQLIRILIYRELSVYGRRKPFNIKSFFLIQTTNKRKRKTANPYPLEAKRQRGQQQHRTILLMLCQLTVGILLMRRLHLRHYMRRYRRITQLIRRLRLRQLTVDILFMRRFHLRHIRCRIIIQLHQWHPEESLIRYHMDIMPRILWVQILGLPLSYCHNKYWSNSQRCALVCK